jgi:hypothetical protein
VLASVSLKDCLFILDSIGLRLPSLNTTEGGSFGLNLFSKFINDFRKPVFNYTMYVHGNFMERDR